MTHVELPEPRLRIECFPNRGWHAYQELFARAIAPYGIDLCRGGDFSNNALASAGDALAGVNLQWAENLWAHGGWVSRLRAVGGLARYLDLAKRLGKPVIWTVHNHLPHRGATVTDRCGLRVVAKGSDVIIVHSRWSERYILDRYQPRGHVVLMPHGNFVGHYPTMLAPRETRASLGLDPDAPLCGMIGGIRANKRHEAAILAVKQLPGVSLLIAGGSNDPHYLSGLRALAGGERRMRVVEGNLSDAQFGDYLRACDLVLFPYADITSSGALLAAWSAGRAVITSDLPLFREFVADVTVCDARAGRCLEHVEPGDWARVIHEMLTIPGPEREAMALATAERYAWDRVVIDAVQAIRGAAGRGPASPRSTEDSRLLAGDNRREAHTHGAR